MSNVLTHIVDQRVTSRGHTRRIVIEPADPVGWEVREEEDSRVVSRVRYSDWHRVERARALIGLRLSGLARDAGVER